MTILEKIIAQKRIEIEENSSHKTIRDLEKMAFFQRPGLSLSASLLDIKKTGIIAEFKRKSPSKGLINNVSSVSEVAIGYIGAGASGVSILSDNSFFGGSSSDIIIARESGAFPILRKDFIIDEYQVIESKALGADVILLIAAALTKKEIKDLGRQARSLGMEVLLEIHDQEELAGVNEYVSMVGVNNRNLKTFEVNTDISFMLADKIPDEFLKVSESGISSASVIKKLREAGYNGFLIGENFMRSNNPVKAFNEFVNELI